MDSVTMCVVEIGGARREVTIDEPMTIGSDPQGSRWVINDARVSPMHCRIEAVDGGWAAVDTSTTGTYVGFEQLHLLQEAKVLDGGATELHLGDPVGPVVTVHVGPRPADGPPQADPEPAMASTGPPPPPVEPDSQKPSKPLWKRWQLYVGLVVLGFIGFGVFQAWRTTDAVDLEAGDCFALPDGDEFTRVTDQGCGGGHDAEVIAVIDLPEGPYPTDIVGLFEQHCVPPLLQVDWDAMPTDADADLLFPLRDTWDDGERTIKCYVFAPSGLDGPAPRL